MKIVLVVSLVALAVLAGCSNPTYGLRTYQKNNLREWEAAGQDIVVEKKPETATVLSLLPGFGSFYTEEPLLGVVDLLLWPISSAWEIWISPASANKINYEATKAAWERRQQNQPNLKGTP